MKKLLRIAILVFWLTGCTSIGTVEFDPADLTYVYEIPGESQSDLYQEILKYIALNFVSAKSVIEYQDEGEGEVIGNGSIKYDGGWGEGLAAHTLDFAMRVRTRDGRIQVSFQNLKGFGTNGWIEQEYTTFTDVQYANIKNKLQDFSQGMAASLSMQTDSDF